MNLMLDMAVLEHGYTPVSVPYMVNRKTMIGTGQLPKFESDMFRVTAGDREWFLIPTAEVPVTNLHADEIVPEAELPLAYCSLTPCFRAEAGSAGRDIRGLIRQHQFDKIEMVRFTKPSESWKELDILTQHAEKILQRLNLHYRVVALCAGDLGDLPMIWRYGPLVKMLIEKYQVVQTMVTIKHDVRELDIREAIVERMNWFTL